MVEKYFRTCYIGDEEPQNIDRGSRYYVYQTKFNRGIFRGQLLFSRSAADRSPTGWEEHIFNAYR